MKSIFYTMLAYSWFAGAFGIHMWYEDQAHRYLMISKVRIVYPIGCERFERMGYVQFKCENGGLWKTFRKRGK